MVAGDRETLWGSNTASTCQAVVVYWGDPDATAYGANDNRPSPEEIERLKELAELAESLTESLRRPATPAPRELPTRPPRERIEPTGARIGPALWPRPPPVAAFCF